jgi:lincosamide nucleotidyltransferase A/C/D/E
MIGSPASRMSATDVATLYDRLEALGVRIWIDGGWGVDALLGEQTRPHGDLDIAIQQVDVPRLRSLLEIDGYADVPRDDTQPWNFVLGDSAGRLIDVHVVVFDAEGNGIYGPPETGLMYPAGSLDGLGVIAGRAVRCIAPEFLVKFHTGLSAAPVRSSRCCAAVRAFRHPAAGSLPLDLFLGPCSPHITHR